MMDRYSDYYWNVYGQIEQLWIGINASLTAFYGLQTALWGLHYFLDVDVINMAWDYFMEYLLYVQAAPALTLGVIKAFDNGHNNGVWHTMSLVNSISSLSLYFLKLNMLEGYVTELDEEINEGDEVTDENQDEISTEEESTAPDSTQEEQTTEEDTTTPDETEPTQPEEETATETDESIPSGPPGFEL